MSATVRAATPADAAAIARVHATAWRETYTGILPQEMVDGLSEDEARGLWTARLAGAAPHGVFVAESDGDVVGYGSGRANDDAEIGAAGLLDSLYILRAGQGLGLGRRLTVAVADELHGRGLADMGVVVHADNPALGFYKAMGAREVVRRTRPHRGFPCPEVLLDWDLPLG